MFRLLTAGFVALLFLLQPAAAQRVSDRGWELLGEKTVGFEVDRDVITVGQSEEWFAKRSYRSLRFAVQRNDVYLIEIRLVYLNGYAENLQVNRPIRAGSQLAVTLPGERSYLRQIEMTYRARPSFRGQAIVKVYGEASSRGIPEQRESVGGGSEIFLGEQRVGFLVDRDTINVGQTEDWFRNRSFGALRFHADGNDVYLIGLRLVYLNGYTEDLRVNQRIRAGADLRVNLQGDRSYLKVIEMTYRARPSFEGKATMKVYGEPARRRERESRRR